MGKMRIKDISYKIQKISQKSMKKIHLYIKNDFPIKYNGHKKTTRLTLASVVVLSEWYEYL